MKVTYKYQVSYRKHYLNTNKMPRVCITDQDGSERLIQINGKPYNDLLISRTEFKTREKAEQFIERKKKIGNAVDLKIHEGSYTVEEFNI